MSSEPFEVYKPRAISVRGVWDFGAVQFKAYDLLAEGKFVTEEMIGSAREFLREEVVPDAEKTGDCNGLGFVIIHPGDLGLTVAAQWWSQGSVLCQRIYRHSYKDAAPLDTIRRPVVACVWELEIIAAEQDIWRETMMNSEPERSAYLKMFAAGCTV